MGKYMRKARISGEVAVVDVPDQAPLAGVRTRARALAIQRRQPLPEPDCYLQLRSRRLEKTQLTSTSKGPKNSGASVEEEEEGVGVSFGDNLVNLESRESACRSARETTPCSSIRNSEAIRTPGSTSRRPPVKRMTNGCKSTPSPGDVEEFFAGAEQLQQRQFMEKYNFDPVNDCPLRGRYEWVKLDSS